VPEAKLQSILSFAEARNVVFVVDDDADMLKGVERLLRAYGFGVEIFSSAEDFHKRANPLEATCLVLDIHLKKESGIELRRQLLLSGFSLPVVFISADDSEATCRAARAVGCADYLVKPFPGQSLVNAIRRAQAA
jgi:FixJ family two-component response regulator